MNPEYSKDVDEAEINFCPSEVIPLISQPYIGDIFMRIDEGGLVAMYEETAHFNYRLKTMGTWLLFVA
jgi:hypothetical protein